MKILVGIKRVVDFKTNVKIKPAESKIDDTNVKMTINPFDEIALEEAIRIKEKKWADEIIAVSIGIDSCQETLRTALAMGADRAILVSTQSNHSPLNIAKILKSIVIQESVQLVLLGKQAIDTDDNQVGQMLAGLLNWAQGCFISSLELVEGNVQVTREIDGGLEVLSLRLPAVITTDLRLNEPRYISLPNIVQSKRKPIQVISLESLNLILKSSIQTLQLNQPIKQRKRLKLTTVSELVTHLKNEAQVIS
jgi:electron transfer flavoprotein beta subunit